jgi:hypothetical protein
MPSEARECPVKPGQVLHDIDGTQRTEVIEGIYPPQFPEEQEGQQIKVKFLVIQCLKARIHFEGKDFDVKKPQNILVPKCNILIKIERPKKQ